MNDGVANLCLTNVYLLTLTKVYLLTLTNTRVKTNKFSCIKRSPTTL